MFCCDKTSKLDYNRFETKDVWNGRNLFHTKTGEKKTAIQIGLILLYYNA